MLFSLLELRSVLNAQTTDQPAFNVLFSEVLLGTSNSGTEEYIELYNTTDQPIDLLNWKVQYSSSSSTNWDSPTRTISLSGTIQPNAYLLIASTNYPSDLTALKYSSTLSQSAGNLRIVHGDESNFVLEDALSWGSAILGLGDSALAPPASLGLNRLKDTDDKYNPTTNNIDDFVQSNILTPLADNQIPEPVVEEEPPIIAEPEQPAEEQTVQPAQQESTQYYQLDITELLPNPAEPVKDSEGEFVEIYNPNQIVVNLKGYQILAGLNGSYKYTFPEDVLINPAQYLVVTSANSSLTLSNTAGLVKLLDPEGEVLSESSQYQSAPEGQSYIITPSGWQWTSTPTPASENVFVAVVPKNTSSTKKATTKKATSTKAKTAKGTAVKSETAQNDDNQNSIEETSGKVNSKLLAGLGALIVLYALYEYRADIRNKIQQFKTNRKNRATAVKSH